LFYNKREDFWHYVLLNSIIIPQTKY